LYARRFCSRLGTPWIRSTRLTFSKTVFLCSSRRLPLQQPHVLEHHPDGAAEEGQVALGDLGRVPPADDDVPLAGQQFAEDQLEEGGFARATGPGEEGELSPGDLEVEVPEGHPQAAEVLADLVELDHQPRPSSSSSHCSSF